MSVRYMTVSGTNEYISYGGSEAFEAWSDKTFQSRQSGLDALVTSGVLIRQESPGGQAVMSEVVSANRVISGSLTAAIVEDGSGIDYLGVTTEAITSVALSPANIADFADDGLVGITVGELAVDTDDTQLGVVPGGQCGEYIEAAITVISAVAAGNDAVNTVWKSGGEVLNLKTTIHDAHGI
ncbi:MAG: hypothetical protein ACTSRU_14305, partial [Candidatus Hodarchaeales archaeon]